MNPASLFVWELSRYVTNAWGDEHDIAFKKFVKSKERSELHDWCLNQLAEYSGGASGHGSQGELPEDIEEFIQWIINSPGEATKAKMLVVHIFTDAENEI